MRERGGRGGGQGRRGRWAGAALGVEGVVGRRGRHRHGDRIDARLPSLTPQHLDAGGPGAGGRAARLSRFDLAPGAEGSDVAQAANLKTSVTRC